MAMLFVTVWLDNSRQFLLLRSRGGGGGQDFEFSKRKSQNMILSSHLQTVHDLETDMNQPD